jgi:hypothetical protein
LPTKIKKVDRWLISHNTKLDIAAKLSSVKKPFSPGDPVISVFNQHAFLPDFRLPPGIKNKPKTDLNATTAAIPMLRLSPP